MRGIALVVAGGLILACGGKVKPVAGGGEADDCQATESLVAEADTLRTEGYLGRALGKLEAVDHSCRSRQLKLALAETLAELGLTKRAIAAYRAYAKEAKSDEKLSLQEVIASLRQRPPSQRQASPEERKQALLLYRDGVNLRHDGQHDLAIKQLRRA